MNKHQAKKSLGQNFLNDPAVIDRIISSLELGPDETVIEIGPGHGALTEQLIKQARQVIAIEFDRDLFGLLTQRFGGSGKFSLISGDALSVDLTDILVGTTPANTKLAANLPYNISTPILQRLIEFRHLFSRLVLMFQKEVVERITAKPGNSDRGFLSVLVENAFETEHLFDVPPTAFRPVPKVWSAVVRLTPKRSIIKDESLFRDLLSRAFAQKRKTILNNLKGTVENAVQILTTADIDPGRRAETLTLDEWVRLTNVLTK
jgi:16S rRNA (adenine1518-N6/adenine1519-N6)-dimethyltransferase